jgi:D-sedoheptulose 7-phosphate isomerase
MPHSQYGAALRESILASLDTLRAYLADERNMTAFNAAVEAIVASYRKGGRLYVAGNGGSAADAQHLAAELVVRLAKERRSIPAEALTVDTSILTAIGNDYGFDRIFSRQIEGKMTADDVFLGVTTSGSSPNILMALDAAKAIGAVTVVLTGRDGGAAARKADYPIIVPGDVAGAIQEAHLVIEHCLCACVEAALTGEE